jgi:hypothetical protein
MTVPQGPEGSEVKLALKPHRGGGPREVSLIRRQITFNPVAAKLCGGPSGVRVCPSACLPAFAQPTLRMHSLPRPF